MQTVTSLQHPLVKHLAKLQRNKRYRKEKQTVALDNKKMIYELITLSTPLNLLISDHSLLPENLPNIPLFYVSDLIIKRISTTPNPEGIVAEFHQPKEDSLHNKKRLIACDAIQDPGNLGTIARTAAALGWEGIFFLENCCDPFNDKALRASKGAFFRLPYRLGKWHELKQLIEKNRLTPLVADLHGQAVDTLPPQKQPLLLFSNEARGVQEETTSSFEKITIPMSNTMESLNVAQAAAILLYTLKEIS